MTSFIQECASQARRASFNAGGGMRNYVLIGLIAAALAGCSSTPTTEAPVDDRSGAGATAPGSTGAQTGGATGSGVTGSGIGSGAAGNPLRDPNNILSKRSVYFDFDSFVVKDEYRPLVEAHARYLQQNRNARMTVQGNTDERGSREYNIALGQKRADSVKRMMTLLGASDNQIETVSFGKEKPRNPGHDEAAWAENRRDDILYSGE
jgi:peptidoglycan-associated lipoprotein